MEPKAFFIEDRVNLLMGVVALTLFVAGGVALAQQQSAATIFLIIGGFMALMVLEYRHVNPPE